MQLYWSLEGVDLHNVWLTIGSFDGVHKGHQAIVRQLSAGAQAASVPSVVLTFHPHPAVILRNIQGAYYLTTPEERAELLSELGADVVVIHPFDLQVARISAQDFMSRLHKHLHMQQMWVGQNFALGRDREGNITTLEKFGAQMGFTLNVISPVILDGNVISSSKVRSALADGDVDRASELLGRYYSLRGKVVHGDGRGKSLGIPTANLDIWSQRFLPKPGVYACIGKTEKGLWKAVANVGYRPTFKGQPPFPQVEAHMLDYEGDLYGQSLELTFMARLRDEKRFPNVNALVDQIHRDIQSANAFLP